MRVDCRLSEAQKAELHRLEAVVERGLKEYNRVGEALLKIRDDRLYYEKYATFEEYLIKRWGMKRAQAYRLIDAHCVRINLEEEGEEGVSPIGDNGNKESRKTPMPTKESQTRPMRGLDPESQRKVWRAAVDAKKGKMPTARDVKKARDAVCGDQYDDEDLGGGEEEIVLSRDGIRDRIAQLREAERLASRAKKIAQDEGCAEAAPLAASFIRVVSRCREELERRLK